MGTEWDRPAAELSSIDDPKVRHQRISRRLERQLLRETSRGGEGPAMVALEEFGSALVTRNASELERIPGLRVVGY